MFAKNKPEQSGLCSDVAEMERFELSHRESPAYRISSFIAIC